MREITSHHDGHGLTERIHVLAVDEPGPGGASHVYQFAYEHPGNTGRDELVGRLQFQKGPRDEPGSIPGVLTVAVLACLIDIQEAFQAGDLPSPQGDAVLEHLRDAMTLLRRRADERASRGVLGKSEL